MSYRINIAGQKDFDTPEEADAWEQEQLDKIRAAIKDLDGVHTAEAVTTLSAEPVDLTSKKK